MSHQNTIEPGMKIAMTMRHLVTSIKSQRCFNIYDMYYNYYLCHILILINDYTSEAAIVNITAKRAHKVNSVGNVTALLYCRRFFIDSYVVECNIPRCYVCLNTWNNYFVICTRVCTCDYVYVGVHACIYNVCMCMFIYICVYESPPWGWRVLNSHFCKVTLWHLLALGGRMIYMCEPACIWLCIH